MLEDLEQWACLGAINGVGGVGELAGECLSCNRLPGHGRHTALRNQQSLSYCDAFTLPIPRAQWLRPNFYGGLPRPAYCEQRKVATMGLSTNISDKAALPSAGLSLLKSLPAAAVEFTTKVHCVIVR